MSLMNDALRKKKREGTGIDSAAGISAPPPAIPKGRKHAIVIAATMFLSGTILCALTLSHLSDRDSLEVRLPPPAPSRAAAGTATEPVSLSVAPEKTLSAPSDAHPLSGAATRGPSMPLAGLMTPDAVASTPPPSSAAEASAVKPAGPTLGHRVQNAPPFPDEEDRPSSAEATPHPTRGFEPGPDPSRRYPHALKSSAPRIEAPVSQVAESRPGSTGPVGIANPAQSPPSDAAVFYQKALACHRGGRLAEAERFYRSALKTDAGHRRAMFNLAALYIEEGRFDQAQPLLERLQTVTPQPKGLLLNLAVTALGRNAPEVALAYLDQTEQAADTPDWQIQFHRALALARLNRFAEALDLYKQVESQKPDDYRVMFNLAVTYDTLADYPQAIRYYEAALKTPSHSLQADRPTITRRMGQLRRYLDPPPSQAKRP